VKQSYSQQTFTSTVILASMTIVFSACLNLSVNKSFTKEDLKYMQWIEVGMNMQFISTENDTVDYRINSEKHKYYTCTNYPSSCSSDTFTKIYYYTKATRDTTYDFKFAEIEKSKNHTQTKILFEGAYNQIPSNPVLESVNYKDENLSDVYIQELVHHSSDISPDNYMSKIWMSISKGLIKYQTGDNKIWNRVD